ARPEAVGLGAVATTAAPAAVPVRAADVVGVRPAAAALEPPLVGAADHVVVAAAAAQQPGQQVGPAHGPLPLPPAGPLGLRPLPGRQVDDGVVVLRHAANPFRRRHLPLAP